MIRRDDEPRPSTRSTELVWTVSQVVFAVSSLFAVLLTATDRVTLNSTVEYGFGIAILIALYSAGIYLIIRRLRQTRSHKFRLAVTGLPQVGKTVFSVLLFDSLMNERVPRVEFSAESRSVIAVYQAIRNLPSQVWPRSTSKGNVSVYTGTIEAPRLRIDLEVGDSAGEYWLDLSDEEDRDPGYLEYVLSAHSIAHVIPLERILSQERSRETVQDIDDLQLVARLRRQTKGSSSKFPLVIVLSKADIVLPISYLTDPESGLLRVAPVEELQSLGLVQALQDNYPESQFLAQLEELNDRLSREFLSVDFIFSSALAVTESRLRSHKQGGDLVRWILWAGTRPRERKGQIPGIRSS